MTTGGTITQLAYTAFRDFETDGQPLSGRHAPSKIDVRAIFAQIDAALTDIGAISGVSVLAATLAALDGHTPTLDAGGLVYNDGSNNGFYVGTGSAWAATGIGLPSSFAADLATLQGQVAALLGLVPADTEHVCGVAQLRLQLVADGVHNTVLGALSANPADGANIQWFSGGFCTPAGALGVLIKATLGYTDVQMATLYENAALQVI